MLRIPSTIVLALCLAAAGCTSSQPPAPPPPAPSSGGSADDSVAVPSPQPTPSATAKPTQLQPAASALVTAATSDTSLRELAARLVESDGHGGWRISEQAATELEKLGPGSAAQLLALLQNNQVEVRRGAAFYLLGAFDPENAQHAAAFSALLDDSDPTVRGIGLSAVKQMPRADQIAAVPRLAAMLDAAREDKADNRAAVARLLGYLRDEAALALPALVTASSGDHDAKVRAACLVAITQIAPAEETIAPLSNGLRDTDASVRLVAAARLRQLGNAAAPAAKELAAALADTELRVRDDKTELRVREAAAEALILIGGPAVDALAGQLTSQNVESRKFALACLAKIGPAAKSALPAIEKCKRDPDENVRKLAEATLKQIGKP